MLLVTLGYIHFDILHMIRHIGKKMCNSKRNTLDLGVCCLHAKII